LLRVRYKRRRSSSLMTSLRRKSNASRRRERRGIVYGKHFNFGWLIDRARAFTMKILLLFGNS
jgi:hypothetical protein